MNVEIKTIETDTMSIIIETLRTSNMKPLAEIFMLWCFELDWEEMPDILTNDQINYVKIILETCCRTFELKIGDHEFSKRKNEIVQEELEEEQQEELEEELQEECTNLPRYDK